MENHHKRKTNLLVRLSSHNGIYFHIAGIIAIIWFLARVVPRPDRIRYPCQQMSVSIAIGYIAFWSLLWSAIFHGVGLWIKRVKYNTAAIAPIILVFFVLIFSMSSNVFAVNEENESINFSMWDPIPKEPIGTPQGFIPGRVAWIWNPDATEKNLNGYWWENQNNNQTIIDQMFSLGIKSLAEADEDYIAWDNLFTYFNLKHGHGEVGYQNGEKIAIKINLNNCGSYNSQDNQRDASPNVVKSLLRQLVNILNVAQEDIIIYDASRAIGDWLYNRIYYEEYPANPLVPEFPNVNYVDSFGGASGRDSVIASSERIYFASGPCAYRTLPTCVVEADYLINMPLLKRHPIDNGVTLSGKNFFGTWMESVSAVHDYHRDSFFPGNPAPQTDLFAHEHVGRKVVLYVGDGLFATPYDHSYIDKFHMYPFNDDWTNSLFFSQDPVAIDSVMYDFLYTEGTNPCEGSQLYLHQSAEPPANVYDPENDGIYLSESLGVHEHWDTNENIFSSERYSGSSNNGIDYVAVYGNQLKAYANGPYYGLVNELIQFNGFATGGNTPYTWEWDFGDGNISNIQNPTHTYSSANNFSVTLTVTDDNGNTSYDNTWSLIQDSNNPPNQPDINGPSSGKVNTIYDYKIVAIDPEGTDIMIYVDWGDETSTGWIGPFNSGEIITKSHKWINQGTYTIRAKAKDGLNSESEWGILDINMPKPIVNYKPFIKFIENFLDLFPFLYKLLLGFRILVL